MKKESWFILGLVISPVIGLIGYGLWFHNMLGFFSVIIGVLALAIIMELELN